MGGTGHIAGDLVPLPWAHRSSLFAKLSAADASDREES